jgi:hypothetical protein
MNKRLKQLGDQAGVCPIKHVGGGEWDSYLPEAEQKFAELIVKECAGIARHHVMDISTYADAYFVEKQITEHFGVKS